MYFYISSRPAGPRGIDLNIYAERDMWDSHGANRQNYPLKTHGHLSPFWHFRFDLAITASSCKTLAGDLGQIANLISLVTSKKYSVTHDTVYLGI